MPITPEDIERNIWGIMNTVDRGRATDRRLQAKASDFFATYRTGHTRSTNAIAYAITLGDDWWAERVEGRLTPTPGPLETSCHLWASGSLVVTGYGQVGVPSPVFGSFPVKVHRLMYARLYGMADFDAGFVIDHLCGQKTCANPTHLEAVSHSVNSSRSCPAICGLDKRRPKASTRQNPSKNRRQAEASAYFAAYGAGTNSQNAIAYAIDELGIEWVTEYLSERTLVSSTLSGLPTACVLWGRGTYKNGYGQAAIVAPNGGSYSVKAHRLAYAATHGHSQLENTHVLDHLCGNRLCVNHLHLEQVLIGENSRRGGESSGGRPRAA